MQYFEFLRSWQRKTKTKKHQEPKLHKTDKQRNKKKPKEQKDKMLLLLNKIGKGCILDKNRKPSVIEVVQNSYKGSFITEEYFLLF